MWDTSPPKKKLGRFCLKYILVYFVVHYISPLPAAEKRRYKEVDLFKPWTQKTVLRCEASKRKGINIVYDFLLSQLYFDEND